MPNSSPDQSPTSAGGVEEPSSPVQADFTDAQLKPAPLRLTRKSNSSGGQSDNSLSRSTSSATSGRTPNGANRNNRESLNTIIHRAATPSTFRTAPSQTSPKFASLVSKFEILDVMGNADAGALRLPSPEKNQKPPRVPTTPEEAELQRATQRQSQHQTENWSSQKHVHISLPKSSQAQRGARSQGVSSDAKVPIANGPKHWDPSNVAERRKLFESGSTGMFTAPSTVSKCLPIVTPVVTRTVARVPSQGEQKRGSEIVKPDQPFAISARRPVAAQVSAPALSSQQSATEGVGPKRERRKSVAALRMSFERSSLPDLQPETPSSAHRPFRRTLTQGLSTATEVPTPVTPGRGSKDPITPTRVRTLRSSEVFAQTYPRLGQATNQPVHGGDSNASSRLKQTQLHNTASRLVGSHDGNVSDAEVDSRRPVTRKNSDTPTRASARTSTRRPSSQHPLLLSRTLSVKITTGPQTMVTLQQPWASHSASGSLPLPTSHSHGSLDQRKLKSGSSSETSASAPLAPANRVKDLQKVFDNNPTGPGSAPFLPFIQKRRAQTLTLPVLVKSTLSAPIMVSTTVAVTTRKASRRSSQQQQQHQSSDVIPETASSTASSVVRTRKRSKTLPSSLGGYRRKTSGPAAGTGSSLGYTSYFQRRKIKKQQKQNMKSVGAGEDSPVKERISLFEQLGGGGGRGGSSSHGHSRNGGNGCGSIVGLPLSMHSKRKSSETTSSSQSRSDRSSQDTDLAAFGRKGRGSSSSGSKVMRVLSFGTSGNRDNGNRSSRNGKALRAAGRKISNAVSMSMSMSKRKDSGDGGEGKGKSKLKGSDGTKAQPLVMSSTNKETGESTFFVKGVLWKVSGSHGDLDLNVAVTEGQSSPEREERKRGESTTETTTTSFPSTRASASGSGSGSSGSAGAIARHPVLQHWPHLDKVNRTVPHHPHDRKSYGFLSLEDDNVAPEWSRGLDDDDPFLQPTRQPEVVTGSSSKIKKSATAPNDVGIMGRKRGFLPTRRSHGDVVEAARGPSTSLRKSFTMAVLPRLSSGNSSNDDHSQDGEGKQKGNKLTKEKGKEVRTTSFPPSLVDHVQSRRQSSISWGQRAAAAAFGIGQRLKERKGSGRSSSLLGKGVEAGAGTGTGGNSSANSDITASAATTTAAVAVPIPISTITTESLRHDE
ncbi:hypothetical protein B0H65DRAFT_523479 [Neurospora tetraspora]|uniref:Uncharacterized protein n=1 Tax=Neurospora tetraspora TaxID=94610 RepID=A0AAE0MTA1_9PEZI|nr:hypothetical protein B0H65DRAFT_523479 [Neurospora tetraspora]